MSNLCPKKWWRYIEACYAGGYPEPEWQELGTSLRVVFNPHTATVLGLQEQKVTPVMEDLLPKQAAILNTFAVGESLSFRQIVEKLGFGISDRSLRYDLAHLRSLGFIISKGRGRALVWQRIK